MDLLKPHKWYPPGAYGEDGLVDNPPYVAYRKANGRTQVEHRTTARAIRKEYEFAEQSDAELADFIGVDLEGANDEEREFWTRQRLEEAAYMRTTDGLDHCLEIALEYVQDCHLPAGDQWIRWKDLPDEELGLTKEEVLLSLGEGWVSVLALYSLTDAILSGLSADQKKD